MENPERIEQTAVNAAKDILVQVIEKGGIRYPIDASPDHKNEKLAEEIGKMFAIIYKDIYDCMINKSK